VSLNMECWKATIAKACMNTARACYSGFFSVAASRTGLRIRNDEVVGSIPTSSTKACSQILRLRSGFRHAAQTPPKGLKFDPPLAPPRLTPSSFDYAQDFGARLSVVLLCEHHRNYLLTAAYSGDG
jgi:hypothetical protein